METSYFISEDYFQDIAPGIFKEYRSEVKRNGKIVINKIPVYTSELAYIIWNRNGIPLRNLKTQQIEIINTWYLWEAYFEGFNEGRQYFEENYKVPASVMYGNDTTYINDLHILYFQKGYNPEFGKGWNFVKDSFPCTLTTLHVQEYGYYSGIISRVDELVLLYPEKFKMFHRSEPTENTLKKNIPDKWYALLHKILIATGEEKQFVDNSKAAIIAYGKKRYKTGQGFYRAFIDIDLNNMTAYVRDIPQKDRSKWKSIIIDLSGKDVDVITWLKDKPDK